MAFVRLLTKLMKMPGNRQDASCPSSPMKRAHSAWSRCSGSSGFTPPGGQLYKPHDADIFLYYKE